MIVSIARDTKGMAASEFEVGSNSHIGNHKKSHDVICYFDVSQYVGV